MGLQFVKLRLVCRELDCPVSTHVQPLSCRLSRVDDVVKIVSILVPVLLQDLHAPFDLAIEHEAVPVDQIEEGLSQVCVVRDSYIGGP